MFRLNRLNKKLYFIIILCIFSQIYCDFNSKLSIFWFEAAPDGVARQVLSGNREFPTPTIRVNKGEKVNFEIQNYIKNGMTDIHFHGLFQKGTLLSDGVGGVTQCDPLFGEKYLYSFKTEQQTGTYWYHSHSGLQLVDGLKGIFIIDDPKDPYLKSFNTYIDRSYKMQDKDLTYVDKSLFYVDHSTIDKDKQPDSVIALTDWHHQLADVLFAEFVTPQSNGAEPTPDSALINGVGNYACKPPLCIAQYNTRIANGKAKKFRIINTSAMAVFHFAIDGHSLYLIETDGVTLDGKTKVDILRINAGQRYSFIVKADQIPGNYWIRAIMDKNIYPNPPSPNWQPEVFGILSYTNKCGKRFDKERPSLEQYNSMNPLFIESFTDAQAFIDLNVPLVPLRTLYNPPPKVATKTFTFNVNPLVGTNNVNYLGFNNIIYDMDPSTTLLGKILNNQSFEGTTVQNGLLHGYNPQIYNVGDVVDIIINNLDGGQHPMHGHGHNFYVMHEGATGSAGYINNNMNPYPYNKDAALRDTAAVNGNSVLVLRFVADNAGIWAFHCHIAWHLDLGLMLTLVEDIPKIKKLYKKYKKCVTNCNMREMYPNTIKRADNVVKTGIIEQMGKDMKFRKDAKIGKVIITRKCKYLCRK